MDLFIPTTCPFTLMVTPPPRPPLAMTGHDEETGQNKGSVHRLQRLRESLPNQVVGGQTAHRNGGTVYSAVFGAGDNHAR